MAPFVQSHETGVASIDAGNDGLRYLLGRVFQPGIECRRGTDGRGACDRNSCIRIQAIIRYMERNFAQQEKVMADSGYPDSGRHKDDHDGVLDRLEVMFRAQVCADRDAAKVHDMVAHWAAEHAQRCDRSLGRWAVTRRVIDPKQ